MKNLNLKEIVSINGGYILTKLPSQKPSIPDLNKPTTNPITYTPGLQ